MTPVGGLREWERHVSVSVSVHVRAGSEIAATVHPVEGRVVLHVRGVDDVALHVFAGRADLVRLVEEASTALSALDAPAA